MDHGLLTSGFSCILQMPTGSGKTWLARLAIKQSLQRGLRAVYLTPLRALAEELNSQWMETFCEDSIGIFTGDYGTSTQNYPVPFKDARVLIMTLERLDACIRNWRSHWQWIPEVDLVVIDEVHMLGDAGRGARLEGTINRLRRLNPFCRFLGLSATLGNRGELADWLDGVEFETTWRPVSLSWRITHYRKAEDKPRLLTDELGQAKASGTQSLVFVQSRRRCESLTRQLQEQGINADYHHAGLKHSRRREVESAFRHRRTQALLATGTLEMGLNLPVRQVMLYDLQGFNGELFANLTTNTVWQRAGRAGRPGLDDQGEAVLFAPTWEKGADRYPRGNFERIESQLNHPATLAEQVLIEVRSGLTKSNVQLERAFNSSLGRFQGKQCPIEGTVEDMLEAGMLQLETNEKSGKERLKATALGRIATRHFLRPATVLQLKRILLGESQLTFFDLIVVAASCPDCEPVLAVDFEELDRLADDLGDQESLLCSEPNCLGATDLEVSGKRLLSVFKTAVVLMHWVDCGEVDEVAQDHNCYPFEIHRLQESMDRLLLAMGAIRKWLDEPEFEWEEETEEKSPQLLQIELLRQMILCGLKAEQAQLTFIDGIGSKLAQRLIDAGVRSLDDLKTASPNFLGTLHGISVDRAKSWIQKANSLAQTETTIPKGGLLRTASVNCELEVDPYRFRRALDLNVRQMTTNEWQVTGGLDPHRVRWVGTSYTCDCPDHAKGHICKHILSVRLTMKDKELCELRDTLAKEQGQEHLDLFNLWFEKERKS